MDRFRLFLVSYGGLGLLPLAPGTWGTAGAALTAVLLLQFDFGVHHWRETALIAALVASVITVLCTAAVERSAGKDPQVVVTDEVAGYFVTLAVLPRVELTHLVAAFFLFRLFDILKPWPGRALERLPGGWGVLLDDIAAGVYGAAILLAVHVYGG